MEFGNNLWPVSRRCGDSTLQMNECCLEIFTDVSPSLALFTRSSACMNCNFTLQKPRIYPGQNGSFILDTAYPVEVYIENANEVGRQYCKNVYNFGNLGKYWLNITLGACHDLEILDEPESVWLNFGVVFSILIGLLLVYGLFKCIQSTKYMRLSRRQVSFQEFEADLGNPDARDQNKSYIQARARRYSRIAAIDVFRGITVFIMIFVNYGGGGYSIFRHSPWDGLTVADIVYPWFIWLMGISIPLSLRSNLRTSVSKKSIFYRIVRRTFFLFILGLILNSGLKHEKKTDGLTTLRIPGVLQRIGATYFVVTLTELLFMKPQRNEHFGPWNLCADIVDSLVQWIIALFLVLIHVLVTFLLPVPDCPTGYLGPGGWHEYSKYENCTGGAAGYIDRLLLTSNHIYQFPTCRKIYHTTVPFDPEGILGTLTCIFCAFLGVQAGRIILSFESTSARIKRWLIWGILLGLVAGSLCNFQKNDGYIPINKNLWSISYVCATSSMAFIIFTILYVLIDYRRIISGGPFLYAGMNALTLYVGHELVKRLLPWYWKPFTETHIEFMSMNLNAAIIWLWIAYAMYRLNIFIVL